MIASTSTWIPPASSAALVSDGVKVGQADVNERGAGFHLLGRFPSSYHQFMELNSALGIAQAAAGERGRSARALPTAGERRSSQTRVPVHLYAFL